MGLGSLNPAMVASSVADLRLNMHLQAEQNALVRLVPATRNPMTAEYFSFFFSAHASQIFLRFSSSSSFFDSAPPASPSPECSLCQRQRPVHGEHALTRSTRHHRPLRPTQAPSIETSTPSTPGQINYRTTPVSSLAGLQIMSFSFTVPF